MLYGFVEGRHDPQLLRGQCRLFDERDIREHECELDWFAGGPIPFFRPFEGSHGGGQMRAGLVLKLSPAPFHQHFQQVERSEVDRALRLRADFRDSFHHFVHGCFAVDFAQDASHLPHEGIDLAAGVADDGIGQAGEQAEVLRSAVKSGDWSEAILRTRRLGKKCLVGQQVIGGYIAGTPGTIFEHLLKLVFLHRFVEGHLGLGVLGVLLGRLIPGGQRAIVGGCQFAGGFQAFEQFDGVVELSEFGIELGERLLPAMVRCIGSRPFGEFGGQFFGPVEGDEQVMLHQPPVERRRCILVVLVLVRLSHLFVAELQQPGGILRLGTGLGGEMEKHADESGLLGDLQQVLVGLYVNFFVTQVVDILSHFAPSRLPGEIRFQERPGGFRHLGQVTLALDVQIEVLQQQPAAQIVLSLLGGSGETIGEVGPDQFHVLLSLFREILAGHLVPLFDLALQKLVPSGQHPVGPAVQMRQAAAEVCFRHSRRCRAFRAWRAFRLRSLPTTTGRSTRQRAAAAYLRGSRRRPA